MKRREKFASKRIHTTILVFAVLSLLTLGNPTFGDIIGGSDLLDDAGLTQLETWLGEGPLDITNIFDKTATNTSSDFHSAVDGQGRTFSLIEVVRLGSTDLSSDPVIIGGYNPQSWFNSGGYNYTYDTADRTAFIFNLNANEVRYQDPTSYRGEYQTYNANYGPIFGGGHDIWVDPSLSAGYTSSWSYGVETGGIPLGGSQGIAGPDSYAPSTYGIFTLGYGQIEVFKIEPSVVPVPGAVLLGMLGLSVAGIKLHKFA